MFKPGDRVKVKSPDGKMDVKGILIDQKNSGWWRITITDPGNSIYEKGNYATCPVAWMKKA